MVQHSPLRLATVTVLLIRALGQRFVCSTLNGSVLSAITSSRHLPQFTLRSVLPSSAAVAVSRFSHQTQLNMCVGIACR